MITNRQIPVPVEPKLIDLALVEIQGVLTSDLSWLDNAYGKSQKLMRQEGGRLIKYPAVYAGSKEYLRVMPDSHLGNFSFFHIEDGGQIDHTGPEIVKWSATGNLIVWFDFETVYPSDHTLRTTENVKDEVIDVLLNGRFRQSKIRLGRVFEEPENVYQGYDLKDIEAKYLMRPYHGFRIEFSIIYGKEGC